MEIKLENIGLISDSTIKLDGLTVITGKNGSGKTTVGKAVYSLIDAVSDLQSKAEIDKKLFVQSKLRELDNSSGLYQSFQRIRNQRVHGIDGQLEIEQEKRDEIPFLASFPALCNLSRMVRIGNQNRNNYEQLPQKLIDELLSFRDYLSQSSESNSFDPDLNNLLISYDRKYRYGKSSAQETISSIEKQIEADLDTLDRLIDVIRREADGDYARNLIDRTLNVEFENQIQPVINASQSRIRITEAEQPLFDISISENHVKSDYEFTRTARKVYFIDDPSVLDEPIRFRVAAFQPWDDTDDGTDSYIQPARIFKHKDKMRILLHRPSLPTALEQGILDAALRPIKEKIDAIIPGTFDFGSSEEYYIRGDGAKLKLANLAAGSKMFSILKILLERGLLDENTVLIMDEPEIHLHPEWQNRFAELIVLLVKELKIKVLMTTHSSNFMLAIDAYMRKYGINDTTNFYHTEFLGNGFVRHNCVNDDMELIYQDFLAGFSEVKALRMVSYDTSTRGSQYD